MKKGCTVYYDNTEMTYYHRLFFTDCRVVWTVSKGSMNYPGSMYESKTDYIYAPHNEDWKNLFVIDGIIKLPVVKPTTSATIYGTWSDNSTTHWNDISKINDIKFEWLDVDAKDFVNFEKTDDTWEVTIKTIH